MLKKRLTEEGTSGEDGDYKRLSGRGQVVTDRVGSGVAGLDTELAKPVIHLDDTRDRTGVVAEEDTTEGGEGSHGDARQLVLGAGGTNAPACRYWTTRHCD